MLSESKNSRAVTAISVLCLFLIIMLFRESEIAEEEIKRGIEICFNTLIPALFPFMVVSELLVRSGACDPISRIMKRPMEFFFGISGAGASALLLGIVCGFPVGAKAAASLYSNGYITKKECEHLLSFCNFPSAPFMIFAVGKGMFGSQRIGIFLYLTILFSGLLVGVITRQKTRADKTNNTYIQSPTSEPIFAVFASSVISAAYSIISVCAFVTFFSCIVGMFSPLFEAKFNSPARALFFSFFELTSGCAACTSINDLHLAVILTAVAGGWSGLSVFLQICSLTRTDGEEISLLPYIKGKVLSAVVCAASSALILYLFPSLTNDISTAQDTFLSVISYPEVFTSAVNIIFIFTSFICFCKLLDRKRKI